MTKIIKIITFVACLAISGTVIAAGEGWFFGLAAGPTKVNNSPATVTATTATTVISVGPISPSNTGFGARIYTGYNFNQYGAVEFGLARYGSSSFKIPASLGIVGSNPEIHTAVFDILGKGTFPFFSSGVNVFVKAGLAAVRISKSKSLFPPTVNQIISCQSTSSSTPGICSGSSNPQLSARPEVAVGVSYDFTPYWEVELSASEITKGGNVKQAIFASLGFSYHWVDVYCGQFLC